MKFARKRALLLTLAIMAAGVTASAQTAPTTAPTSAPAPKPVVTALTVSPAAPVKPVMKYSLLPRIEDHLTGNPAGYYLAAVAMQPKLDSVYYDLEEKLRKAPVAEMTQADINALETLYSKNQLGLYQLRLAARMDHPEWPVNLDDGVGTRIPSLSQYRTLAARLSIDIKIDIHDKRYDAALEKIRILLTFARHLGEGKTMIEGLVALGIAAMAQDRLLDLASQSDAPNLYWVLAELPRPLIRIPFENERGLIYFTLPELKKVRDGTFTDNDWPTLARRLGSGEGMWRNPSEKISDFQQGASLAGIALAAYPAAKRYYQANGKTDAEIEAIGARKIVAGYLVDSWETWMDEFLKYRQLPYYQAIPKMKAVEAALAKSPEQSANILMTIMVPSFAGILENAARVDQMFDAVQAVEALRLYAAEHGGRWPEKLSDCVVPVPDNSATGKPFGYRIQDGKAILYFEFAGRYEKQIHLTLRAAKPQ